ncbi:M20/M25/M40 family metallo-hydrolase [Alkaliphilus peptidifermentans]|uniref:Peptidase T-like protein n=1 Tax=Alkaliphilus peptidifermentans DSM 18978 TaxID=1120976 RepID=A0A1G5AME7_9FIRM|nr:M20/M25/M40 family metallo-hydrolase [Alkaliphilus peptidifermentans]SCX79047.1 peptidase T-like protein [Alkaliphilus peptidifermentans DSM 18978]
MVNRDRIVNEFLELVQIDSLSGKEGKISKVLAEKLKKLGLEVTIDNSGEKVGGETGNVIGRLKGKKNGPTILFSCHMDTVKPGEGVKPIIKDEVIYSDGTTILGGDNKAGIAAVLEGIRLAKENNIEHSDVEVIFSIWEEGGLFGAKNLDYSKVNAQYGFVLDSGGSPGEIVVVGPAQDKVNAKIIGKPAHAGVAPEEGVSAIMIAARAIDRMKLLRIDEETTANIGVITGGEATNIVTPEVLLKGESRSINEEKLNAQTKHMVETLQKAAEELGGKIEPDVERMYPAFNIDVNDEIVLKTKEIFNRMGIDSYTTSTGGGSDTNIFNGNGIKAINLGIGEKKPHTLEEHLHIKDLTNSGRMVFELIKIFGE